MKKLISIVCIFLCLMSLVNCSVKRDYENNHNISRFTKENWNEYPYVRIYIVEDLNKQYQINKMTRSEVYDLLGDQHCTVTDDSLTYTLGKRREDVFFSYFTIQFDKEDNVIKAYVYQD